MEVMNSTNTHVAGTMLVLAQMLENQTQYLASRS